MECKKKVNLNFEPLWYFFSVRFHCCILYSWERLKWLNLRNHLMDIFCTTGDSKNQARDVPELSKSEIFVVKRNWPLGVGSWVWFRDWWSLPLNMSHFHDFGVQVEFMLLELKRGYVVVGEVSRGEGFECTWAQVSSRSLNSLTCMWPMHTNAPWACLTRKLLQKSWMTWQ